jgi:hypothetical protein
MLQPNNVRVIKTRRMRWVLHEACMGEKRNTHKILAAKYERIDYVKDLGVNGKIILKWILGKQGGKIWTGCIWLRIGTSGRLL